MFALPLFEDDDLTREARLLYIVLLILLVLSVVFTATATFVHEDPRPLYMTGAVLIPLLISSLMIARGGRVRVVSIVTSIVLWLFITLIAFLGGTVRGPSLLNYFTVITVTALVWDRRASMVLAGLSLLATLALLIGETQGWLPQPSLPSTTASYWMVFAGTMCLIAGLIFVATKSLSGSLRRTRQSQRALGHSLRQLQETQNRLLQAQKMEAVGRLAGGVAHDFNNHLTAIRGYAEMAAATSEMDDQAREDVQEIKKSVDRAARLTRQLLAFSRKQLLQPQTVDLNALVADCERMLRRLIGEDIDIALRLGSNLHFTLADPGQIETVIINLALNARDAMPDGGQIIIETANVELEEPYLDQRTEAAPGSYVMIAVTDTGVGMDPETRDRVFEPFFTTKDAGHGTGLGLSTVYGIVKQSDGYIWVYSEPGEGTTIKVYLPRSHAQHEEMRPTATEMSDMDGTETIMVVEDDQAVLDLVARTLERRGYTVSKASRADLALSVARLHEDTIDLLLTDIILPGGKSGRELAQELLEERDDMKVLYMSGYTPGAISHHGVLDSGIRYLQKPFSPDGLSRTVRQILDES